METLFDAYISFPADEYVEQTVDRLCELLDGNIERVEEDFEIEFSCGDGKFITDFWDDTEGGAIVANFHTDEEYDEVAKYDGKTCLLSPARFWYTKELFKLNKDYRFTVKSFDRGDHTEVRFYINGKERTRREVL